MKTYFILLVLAATLSVGAMGQTRVIAGYVTTLNDLTVANLRVTAQKSGSAVLTDSLGRFSVVALEKDILQFTSRDKVFDHKKVRINKRTPDTLKVQVKFLNTPENQELAVGYGYVKQNALTNAMSQMENKNSNFCHYSDIFELIKGRMPGVEVIGGGSEPQVIIRGISSIIASNTALYVVDGMVVNSISHISPCHVKSINVLKDSSASIYGSRGANGVVLIQTLKGGD
jgi:TonB-dependent SusC/RagA subfamily outer membrane receptor